MKYLKYRRMGSITAIVANDVVYVFLSKNNISLCQVNENHVAELLLKRCGCCGSEFSCFAFASQEEINMWNSPEE